MVKIQNKLADAKPTQCHILNSHLCSPFQTLRPSIKLPINSESPQMSSLLPSGNTKPSRHPGITQSLHVRRTLITIINHQFSINQNINTFRFGTTPEIYGHATWVCASEERRERDTCVEVGVGGGRGGACVAGAGGGGVEV